MQISELGIRLLENQIGYSYYLWETEGDQMWDRNNPDLTDKQKRKLDLLKKRFEEWVKFAQELGLVVEFDNKATAQYGQAIFHVMSKENFDSMQKLGLTVSIVQVQ